MKKQTKKISLRSYFAAPAFLCAALFGLAFLIVAPAQFSLAQTATPPASPASPSSSATATAPVKQYYYLISLTWDSEKNTITLNNDQNGKPSASLSRENLIKDTGGGSQFFARVINSDKKYQAFSNNDAKIFLGKWSIDGGGKQGKILTTVPYFPKGQKIIIVDAKTKIIALVVDVSGLAAATPSSAGVNGKVLKKVPIATPMPKAYKANGNSALYGWVMMVIILVILGGGGYWLYRFYKKRKNTKALASLQPPSIQNKI